VCVSFIEYQVESAFVLGGSGCVTARRLLPLCCWSQPHWSVYETFGGHQCIRESGNKLVITWVWKVLWRWFLGHLVCL